MTTHPNPFDVALSDLTLAVQRFEALWRDDDRGAGNYAALGITAAAVERATERLAAHLGPGAAAAVRAALIATAAATRTDKPPPPSLIRTLTTARYEADVLAATR